MSTETKAPEEEPLCISNVHVGQVSYDTEAIVEAIYALAREVRLVRHELSDRLGEIRDSVRR